MIYADVGVRIVSALTPVVELARNSGDVVVFDGRGHFSGQAHRNQARCWTKRDCFLLLGCDEPAFHDAAMVDASLVVAINTPRARAFVAEWLDACRDPRALTDAPNSSGVDNLPEFHAHLHDQSILTLLARRHGLRGFRCPSQYGNHCKPKPLRVPGEFVRRPYGSEGIDEASPYPTLCVLHRLRDFPLDDVGDVEPTFANIAIALARRFAQPKVVFVGRTARAAWLAACDALDGGRVVLWLDDGGDAIALPPATRSTPELIEAPLTDAAVWTRLAADGFDAVVACAAPLDVMIPVGMLRSWRHRPFLCAWQVDEDISLELGRIVPHFASHVGFDHRVGPWPGLRARHRAAKRGRGGRAVATHRCAMTYQHLRVVASEVLAEYLANTALLRKLGNTRFAARIAASPRALGMARARTNGAPFVLFHAWQPGFIEISDAEAREVRALAQARIDRRPAALDSTAGSPSSAGTATATRRSTPWSRARATRSSRSRTRSS